MAFPLLPVMDYFIQTCNWAALLMDSSHCYGKVTLSPSLGPLLISVNGAIVQNSPLNHTTLTTMDVSVRHLPDSSQEKKKIECFPDRIHGLMGAFLIL